MKHLLLLLIISTMITMGCKAKLEKIDVDCSDLTELLDEVWKKDQGPRMVEDQSKIDFGALRKTDKENLAVVVSIIEQCGMPTSDKLEKKHIKTMFYVFQHSSETYQKKYFPILKDAAARGDLEKSTLAKMEDRILMFEGKPQIYGTQLHSETNAMDWKLYKLEDPEYVDKRRAEVGLGPLSEYLLENWELEFNVEQME